MAASGIRIIEEGYGPGSRITVPVASATVIERGDPISLESSLATVLATVTDDGTFIGLADTDSVSGDTTPLRVLTCCVAEATVSSASYSTGDGLLYVSGDATTAFVFADDGNANTLGWATETKATTTTLKILFDAVTLQKQFSSAA